MINQTKYCFLSFSKDYFLEIKEKILSVVEVAGDLGHPGGRGVAQLRPPALPLPRACATRRPGTRAGKVSFQRAFARTLDEL